MQVVYRSRIWLVTSLLMTVGCVDQIDFIPAEETGTLVVDGAMIAPNAEHFIQLSRTDVLGKRVFPAESDATITIFDDLENSAEYRPREEGLYVLSGNEVNAEVGRSYHIEIVLASGKKYRSEPEFISPAIGLDRVRYETAIEPVIVDENKIVERSVLNIFADATFAQDNADTYFRYQVEHQFLVSEILCSPLQPLKFCYITRDVQNNGIILLDGSRLLPGAQVSRKVASSVIDYALGEAAGYQVSQQSLSRRAFDYWTDLNLVINNSGTVFDAAPAAIPGNIFSVDDPDEEVLGFFGAYAESSAAVTITRGDVDESFRQFPLCGLPGLLPAMLDPACCNCLRHVNSSYQAPTWWPL